MSVQIGVGTYTAGIGTVALINACLAQSRNRGAVVWFVVSLVLGPLATLLLASWGPVPGGRYVLREELDQYLDDIEDSHR
jgi:hypothetical protein